jgi:hypothetical protein
MKPYVQCVVFVAVGLLTRQLFLVTQRKRSHCHRSSLLGLPLRPPIVSQRRELRRA